MATDCIPASNATFDALASWLAGAIAPADLADCRLLGMITRSPDLEHFAPADGGKVAYDCGQWVNARGEPGPLSEVAAATITALM